jgi:hypothetical protein
VSKAKAMSTAAAKRVLTSRAGRLFTLGAYPAGAPNSGRWRWCVYRDGVMVGVAKTKADALRRVTAGFYDEVA